MDKLTAAYIVDGVRTPIGRYGGGLSSIRTDDLGAIALEALQKRQPQLDFSLLEDVYFGCANQAGEDNRNVARMSLLLAGFDLSVPGSTINRLCGSGLDAISIVARGIKAGELNMAVAGGVESMSRAPLVMGKADTAFSRAQKLEDTTMGWRFINPKLQQMYGVELMGETAENVAEHYQISRADQDAFALQSQQRYEKAFTSGYFKDEITSVEVVGSKRGETRLIDFDEHPRLGSTLAGLEKLRPLFREGGTVTAGNASGINDGAAALLIASQQQVEALGLRPRARILGCATAGVEPSLMGMGPVPATNKLLQQLQLTIQDFDAIELNEAFAAQALACARELGVPDDAPYLNPNGGAIALGHPLGMSGTRLVLTLLRQLEATDGRLGLATMCIGVGQGIAVAIERL